MTRPIVALLLASALLAACGEEPKGKRSSEAATPAAAPGIFGRPGELVEIADGRTLFVHCVGSGSPAVVLEAGLNGDTNHWRYVQPQIGRSARTCSYDRAGVGNSAVIDGVHDAREEVADLRRLLDRLDIRPPYVLVGHSYGGVLARVFAQLHPTETAGLVLVDTLGPDGRRRLLAIWPESQAPEIRRELAPVSAGVDLAAGDELASRLDTLGDKPLAVITAGRPDNLPRSHPRLRRALDDLSNRMQAELARLSQNSVHVVALRSRHDVPLAGRGQPPVVIRAAQAVVQAARDGTPLPPCGRLFRGWAVRCQN